MDFNYFVEIVKNTIKNYLSDEFMDARIDIYPHEKLNEEPFMGMTVRTENQGYFPVLNLNMFYKQLQDNSLDAEEIMKQMAEFIQNTRVMPALIKKDIFTDYKKIKNNLFIRVSNAEKNRNVLTNVPHTCIENLAITYHIFAGSGHVSDGSGMEDIVSSIVTNEMLTLFNVSKDQLHQDALENTSILFPAKIESLNMICNMIISEMEAAGANTEEIDEVVQMMKGTADPLTVVTNEQMIHGASVLFYPGQMDKIGELLKGNYYILPSSIHEMLVLPDNGEMDSRTLKYMVMEINNNKVRPEERLADDVYYYDTQNRIFKRICS